MTYKTSIGLRENIVGVLCYVGFWMTGILFLFIERENRFVRFHALQSVMTFVPLTAFVYLVAWVPYYGWLLADIFGGLSMLIFLILAFQALRGSKFKLPIVGKKAYNYIYK